MELPQSRPYGTEGGRKPTHDFLSLYSHSTPHQDPKPSSQGGYLKTHDFLKPLEREEGNAKEEVEVEVSTSEKPPPTAPPPSVEHVLPGGIGTYSISHISYFNPRAPKPEGEIFAAARGSISNGENSNGSLYSGSGFSLWEESAAKMGQAGKENAAESALVRDGVGKAAPWRTSMERASNSSTNNHRNSFCSFSSSQQSLGQKSQSVMEMIKSAKVGSPDEEFDDDDLLLKKESSTTTTTTTTTATTNHKGELRVKVDGKSAPDQKSNTPRSKHSATEQRRRSKINDRFQMLRDIIPHGDQKRDKASFLLEVIEYIRFLQEKVHKYDGPYQGLSQEPAKPMLWWNGHRTAESYATQSRAVNNGPSPAYAFEKNIAVSPTTPGNVQNRVESGISPATPALVNQSMPFPVSLHPNFFTSGQNGGAAAAQLPLRLASDAEKNIFQSQPALCQAGARIANGTVSSDKLKEQELTIEGGTISISSVYSQGLLNTLTKALQSCGMDLSQASISVQIELGKQASSRATAPLSTAKDNEISMINQGISRSQVSCDENSERAIKKLKTGKS